MCIGIDPVKILFIGSNPSQKAASNYAFSTDTASGRLLQTWIEGIQGEFFYDNIVSQKTENNRPLRQNEIGHASVPLLNRIKEINPDRIVALGKSAASALLTLKVNFFEMPHPSGLNRLLNDKDYTSRKIQELKEYCKAS